MQRAFDEVDYGLLIKKFIALEIFGNLLRWLISYLTKRLQTLAISGCQSDFIEVKFGLPQELHLKPL